MVAPVDLPGHGARRGETVIDEWEPLTAELIRTVRRDLDGPYVLAGHSFGALLAYEIAAGLHRTGPAPELLVVAGRNGPTAALSHRPIHGLPDTQLVGALRRLGGTPESVLAEPDLMRLMLPLLRADLRLAETYARRPGPALPCPIAAIVGRRDQMTDPAAALAWHRETSGRFDLTIIEAGHFLLDHPEFVGAVSTRVSRLLTPPARR